MERLNLEMISDDAEVRRSALTRMDELARSRDVDAAALPSLMILLRSASVEDRQRSSRIAAKMAQNRVEAFWPFDLLNALTEDEDAEVRENAAWTLGELASMRVGVHSSVAFLAELLLDREAMVRGDDLLGHGPVRRASAYEQPIGGGAPGEAHLRPQPLCQQERNRRPGDDEGLIFALLSPLPGKVLTGYSRTGSLA